MRKLVLAAAVTLFLTRGSKPAEARCGSDCPPIVDALSWTLAAGLVGGYAYGTGYFIHRDATDAEQSLDYGGAELGVNAPLALLFGAATAGAIDRRQVGQAAIYGALALTHGALAGHGAWRVYQHRGELRPEPQTLVAIAGIAYATNTLMWGLQVPGHHGRGHGVAEAAVNAPLAAGLGYLAADRARSGDTRQAALFGGMAALSGALAIHGAYLALRPARTPSIDDLNFDLGRGRGAGITPTVAPTVVTDGKDVAPGLGASGTW